MGTAKVWHLDDAELPAELHVMREVFMERKQSKSEPPKDARNDGESLHDYFMRKGMACFCRFCRAKREDEARKNNEKLSI